MLDDRPVLATLALTCDGCGAAAATVSLLGPAAEPWLRCDGFLGRLTARARPADVPALRAALERRDLDALDDLEPEAASCRCLACDRIFCDSCWRTTVELDDGFFDCIRGVCPQGHRRMLQD